MNGGDMERARAYIVQRVNDIMATLPLQDMETLYNFVGAYALS